MMEIFLAITMGLLFGFALNRAGATNPENIINMLRLTDLRLMKAIIFAIGLSAIALFSGLALGLIDSSHISVKSAYWGVIVGGALLGIGFSIAGYCPGTGLAAFATGRKDAFVFVLGGFVGAFFYTLAYGWFVKNTPLYNDVLGGNTTLADTGNEKFVPLVNAMDGTIVGIGFGIVMVILAIILPLSLRKG